MVVAKREREFQDLKKDFKVLAKKHQKAIEFLEIYRSKQEKHIQ